MLKTLITTVSLMMKLQHSAEANYIAHFHLDTKIQMYEVLDLQTEQTAFLKGAQPLQKPLKQK